MVIVSKGAPVKSRIAMWAERERESRESSQPSLSPQLSPQHSPHASPKGSPNHSPKGLRRQSPIDKSRGSPIRSAGSSRAGSVVGSKANSASPPRQVPSIRVEEKEEETNEDVAASPRKSASNSVTEKTTEGDEVYEDIISSPKKLLTSAPPPSDELYEDIEMSPRVSVVEPCVTVSEAGTVAAGAPEDIYSTIPDVYDNFPKGNHLHEHGEVPSEASSEAPMLPPRPDSMKSTPLHEGGMQVQDIEDDTTLYADVENGSSYTRLKPVYTEMTVLDDPSDSGVPASNGKVLMKSTSNLTPRTKRRWLRSPFSRRKGSGSEDRESTHSEGAKSDREREEKKSGEGFMKKKFKIGSRSSKSRKAVKHSLASESVGPLNKASYDSDSDGSSSVEESQSNLTASDTMESRTRSSSEIGQSDLLMAEVIPRSHSYSPSPTPEGGYVLTTRKKLDPSSQRVVSSDSETLRETNEAYETTMHKKLDPLSQRVISDTSLAQSSSNSDSISIAGEKRGSSERLSDKPIHYRKSPSTSPQRGTTQLHKSISRDILSMIDNMGEGLEFCEEYSKKLHVPPLSENNGSGSAPGGLSLPVPFQLKPGSSHPNLKTVGFDAPPDSDESRTLSNGVGSGDADEKRGASDSSTASEEEEQGSSGPEREDSLDPVESSLDRGRDTRYVCTCKYKPKITTLSYMCKGRYTLCVAGEAWYRLKHVLCIR